MIVCSVQMVHVGNEEEHTIRDWSLDKTELKDCMESFPTVVVKHMNTEASRAHSHHTARMDMASLREKLKQGQYPRLPGELTAPN